MTKLGLTIKAAAVAVALFSGTGLTAAQNVTISVWAGGTGPNDNYRVDAIDIAADILSARVRHPRQGTQHSRRKEDLSRPGMISSKH